MGSCRVILFLPVIATSCFPVDGQVDPPDGAEFIAWIELDAAGALDRASAFRRSAGGWYLRLEPDAR